MSDKVFQMMAIHIYNLVKRNQQDHVLKNDMHEAIIDKYPEMYGVAKECMAILEAGTRCTYSGRGSELLYHVPDPR